ncbi:hypothetical protein RN001_010432 [Aquatica leii]|uniref:Uncharacterized protein n=1 Tax=Aquatica leii TaxID=1421715 RepID=A0AAN7P9X9_9COLE|nr:hypothetical protein RN001_010432 [Aquatica leii]
MLPIKTVINVFVFLTVVQAGLIDVISKRDLTTRDTADAHDVFANNGSSQSVIYTIEDETNTTYSLVFKFFTLIIGGIAVFAFVQVIMHCCHDNKNITFARIRRNQPPPCAIFMHSFNKDDPDTKYKCFEYIDVEPLHDTKDIPMMSPMSKQ